MGRTKNAKATRKSLPRKCVEQKKQTKKPAKKLPKRKLKLKPNVKETERCKEWLISQQNYINDYENIDENTLQDAESNFDHDRPKTDNTVNKDLKKSKMMYKIDLACEWGKCNQLIGEFDDFEKHICDHIDRTVGENPYRCQWDLCSFKSYDPTMFTIHVCYHAYHTKLKTKGEVFLHERKLPPCVIDSRRRNFIPENLTEFTCQWELCDFKSTKIYEFYEHIRLHCSHENAMELKHVRNYVRQFKCGWVSCSKKFTRISPLLTHVKVHVKQKICACPNCGSSFMSNAKFYAHFIRQSDHKPYQCAQCLKHFSTEELLCRHMYSHVNCYKCTLCDMTCPSPSALTKHIRYRHLTEKPFKCRICSYSAVYKYDLDKHIISKHEKPIHECEEFGCDFTTDSFNLMRKHDRDEHGMGPYIYCCHCCSMRFPEGRRLSRHLIRKHGFQLPSGHTRFLYRQQIDGFFKLQTMRMESLEVTQQLMLPPTTKIDNPNEHNVSVKIAHVTEEAKYVSIVLDVQSVQSDTDDDDLDDDLPANEPLAMPMVESSNDTSRPFELKQTPNEINRRRGREKGIVILASSNSTSSSIPGDGGGDEQQQAAVKSIDDFSVMKRYIKDKKKNNIIIEMKELDASGNVINTETINADEYCIKKKMAN